MKVARTIFGIAILAGLIALGVWIWSSKIRQLNEADIKDGPGYSDKLTLWRSQAELLMLGRSSNDVAGFNRLVNSHVDTSGGNVNSWSGEVTADYINHVGGIDRTNLHYAFDSVMGDLSCSQALASGR